MSLFGTDHLSENPLDITAGPSVSWGEAISQGLEEQFRVRSPLSLEQEVQNRWMENLTGLERLTGERFEMPRSSSFEDESLGDLKSYMEYLKTGQNTFNPATSYQSPEERLEAFRRADERIKELQNPEIKSFEEVIQEVYAMQEGVLERSAELTERGDVLGQMIGAIAGSFSTRDPLSLYSLTIGGAGRTIPTRIASEMGIGAAVAGAGTIAYVNPNLAQAGLPEQNVLYDMVAAGIGAGVFRGGLEGIAVGVRRLSPERGVDAPIMDFSDNQLRQMFENNTNSPRARAGDTMLDDIQFVERNNPYGVGDAANARFLAELQEVQKVMGGAPATAIARVLPPVPFEYIRNAADFEIVKQQAPQIYAKLETAQARVSELETSIANATTRLEEATIIDAVRLVDEEAAGQLEQLARVVNDETLPEPQRATADLEANAIIQRVGPERAAKAFSGVEQRTRNEVRRMRGQRRTANEQYRAAYREVEAEAQKLRRVQEALRGTQQREAVDLLGNAIGGRPFIGSALQYDHVAARVDAINAFNDTLDEKSLQLFQKQEAEPLAEGAEPVEPKPVYDVGDGRFDIGLREPVDGEFRFATDDGDMSIADAMRDLDDDVALEEAMRTCLI